MSLFWATAIFSTLFGLLIGSFLNVCICRIPKGESIVSPPSHCPTCKNRISWYDNIPLFSYLLLKGKCRKCGLQISFKYPLVELLNALLTLALFLRFGISVDFIIYSLLCSSLVVVTFIDLKHQIIPDEISLSGIFIGFIASFFLTGQNWKSSIAGILLGGGSLLLVASTYYWLTRKEGMGGGDIKLLAMLGAFLGWQSIPFILFSSSLVGSVVGITIMVAQKKDTKFAIPFGPYLAFSAVLYVFYGKEFINYYLHLGGFIKG